jgi:hypothetical protein
MNYVFAPQPTLHRKHCQDRQSDAANLAVADREPRQNSQCSVSDQCSGQAIHPSNSLRQQIHTTPFGISPAGSAFAHARQTAQLIWCTGKDSNLRTSLGGTDLQSVGFNHSPTCAKTIRRRLFHPIPIQLWHILHQPRNASRRQCFATNRSLHHRVPQNKGNQESRQRDREKPTSRKPPQAGKLRMEWVGKTCYAASESAAACRKIYFLELAKGFEPPTP